MTVQELIDDLKKQPPELLVKVGGVDEFVRTVQRSADIVFITTHEPRPRLKATWVRGKRGLVARWS